MKLNGATAATTTCTARVAATCVGMNSENVRRKNVQMLPCRTLAAHLLRKPRKPQKIKK